MRAQFFFMPQQKIFFSSSFFQFRIRFIAKREKENDAETTLQTGPLCFSATPIFALDGFVLAPCARFDERVKTVLVLLGGRERDRIHHFFQRVVVNEFDTLVRVRF